MAAGNLDYVDSIEELVLESQTSTVLVVEPVDTDQFLFKKILQELNFHVVCIHPDDDVIKVVEEKSPAVVFYHIDNAIESDEHLLSRIKSLANDSHAAVHIVLTMTQDNQIQVSSSDQHHLFDDICIKPVNESNITARLNTWKRLSSMQQLIDMQIDRLNTYSNRINQEMELAQKIIANLNRNDPSAQGNVKKFMAPKDVLSGDIFLSADKPNGNQVFLIGDLTGHGLPAAVGAMVVYDIFYTMSKKGFLLGQIAMEINKKLSKINETGRFMCVCMIELDNTNKFIHLINAGLPDVLVYNNAEGIKHQFKSTNLPVGILSNEEYTLNVERIALEKKDQIFIYTDGLNETTNNKDEILGNERILSMIEKTDANDNIFLEILKLMHEFQSGSTPDDDVTLVEIICDEDLVEKIEMDPVEHAVKEAMEWELELNMGASLLKHDSFLPLMLQNVTEIQGLQPHREQIYTILAEMFSNALEHGMLELDSAVKKDADGFSRYYGMREKRLKNLDAGNIKLGFKHEAYADGGKLTISMQHSGDGFDHEAYMEKIRKNNQEAHGRGMLLINSLCRDLRYSEEGRRLEADYIW